MDEEQIPISMVTDLLLPGDLRGELCIRNIAIDNDQRLITFRIDPGNAFARRGYVRNLDGARFLVGVSERYLPDDPRRHVCGSDGIPAGDVPDQLRVASGWAYTWDAARNHWLDARQRHAPAWSDSRSDIASATVAAAERARQERLTHYLCVVHDRFVYANNPPRIVAFFSITARGDWSVHHGPETYPLESAPDASSIGNLLGQPSVRTDVSPARLARADLAANEGMVLPFRQRDGAARTTTSAGTRRGRRP
ncbi:MAG: hypothetical protein JO345_02000 [Streptosporangiaceae bacterium]|nr:hypothetical protein [Streptosporangiaceae bacterium]